MRGSGSTSRFDFGPVAIKLHHSNALSALNVQLYGGTAYVLGGLEGVVAMKSKTAVASWMQFDLPRQRETKLCAGSIFDIGNWQAMLAGFSRTSNSDTIVYFVSHPNKVNNCVRVSVPNCLTE